MFIASVASVSLAVFTDLSILELNNADLVQAHQADHAIETAVAPVNAKRSNHENVQAQEEETASRWAESVVKRHRARD